MRVFCEIGRRVPQSLLLSRSSKISFAEGLGVRRHQNYAEDTQHSTLAFFFWVVMIMVLMTMEKTMRLMPKIMRMMRQAPAILYTGILEPVR